MMRRMKASSLVALGLGLVVAGLYAAHVNPAPGSPVSSTLVMVAGIALAVRGLRHRLSPWTARAVIACGALVAAPTAFLVHGAAVAAPLFPQAQQVPSTASAAPAAPYAPAVESARAAVRAAIREQNLPGVSVAVGAGGTLVWAEGFGWRDIATQASVTPTTRFHIGTAAAVIQPAAASLALAHTGTDTAADWSPEHVGEPEEDAPPLALLRHVVWQPLGLMPPLTPLAGERATFYVPRHDDHDPRRGRRLMYMRDLACCLDGKAYSSTPADLVRIAVATSPADIDGTLAGGTVMSLVTRRDRGLVVAVTSNIAYANTPALARRIADAFAATPR
jgi:hypothetical protein